MVHIRFTFKTGCDNFDVGSFVGELLAEEVLPQAWLVRRRRWGKIPLSPDEEDVGVEWNCCDGKLLSVLL
jgi:hypothetical protein